MPKIQMQSDDYLLNLEDFSEAFKSHFYETNIE